jgi:hypothetical protein
MSFGILNLENGDLGVTSRITDWKDVETTITVAATCMSYIATIHPNKYRYCIQVSSKFRKLIEMLLNVIVLPSNLEIYSVDGQKLFDMRGSGGGIVTGCVFYLVSKEKF